MAWSDHPFYGISFEKAKEWADSWGFGPNGDGLWDLALKIARHKISRQYAGTGHGIGSSDIAGARLDLVRRWMLWGTENLERAGVLTRGIGGRVGTFEPGVADYQERELSYNEGKEMTTTTGGIAGLNSGGWERKPVPHTKRRIGAEEPEEPGIVEPAPKPKKRSKQLIVGDKNPFMERLEQQLSKQLGEMEDFQLLNTLAGGGAAAAPNSRDAGIGPRAKGIQQRVEMDNSTIAPQTDAAKKEQEEGDEEK